MSWPGSVALIGLGLVGGSLARDLRARGVHVSGWDRDPSSLAAAGDDGIVTPLQDDLAGVGEADLVVLAVPVGAAPGLLARVAGTLRPDALVTDVASTKRTIVRAAGELGLANRFVGSHPLAGDHRAGWAASRAGLFEGARVFITPCDGVTGPAVDRIASVWTSVGARAEITDAVTHDATLAWVSHLPQALSTALGLALADAGMPRCDLGPGGRDATRLAGSSAALWTEILADNGDNVVAALRAAGSRLGSITAAVERGDLAELRRMLEAAERWAGEQPAE